MVIAVIFLQVLLLEEGEDLRKNHLRLVIMAFLFTAFSFFILLDLSNQSRNLSANFRIFSLVSDWRLYIWR